eukprot:GHVO01015426.1.p1 GENE.GHVO01015426.1~~GHVO01015426.1.p1  ORF type:complete len:435 (-),score=82.25 GHVO01015426.1:115-1398(-)
MSRQFDLVIFGATGFTGKHVVKELAELGTTEIKWAIAGRSEEKLRELLSSFNVKSTEEGGAVGVIVADVENIESLDAMCKMTRMIITVVGPYRKYGEPLVAACVRNNTDCLDICGEPEFLERAVIKYNDDAKTNNTLIVQSCGLDSIPADYGCHLASKCFEDGVMTHADTFLNFESTNGFGMNFGTYEAAVLGFGGQEQLKELRKLAPKKKAVKRLGAKPSLEMGPFRDDRVPYKQCFMFPGADASVIRRTQELTSADIEGYTGFHIRCFFCVNDSLYSTMKTRFFGGIFKFLTGYERGRSVLLRYPSLFTGGIFTKTGPTQEMIDGSSFTIEVFATGYSTKALATEEGGAPDKMVKVTFGGPDPAYKGTARMLIAAARATLKNRDQMKGGVYTPACVLAKTDFDTLIQEREFTITYEDLKIETEVQ